MNKEANEKKYYIDAIEWYNSKYIFPLYERSILILFSIIIGFLLIVMVINVNKLLPIIKRTGVILETKKIGLNKINIAKLNYNNDAQTSIAHNLIEHYVMQREQYSYDNLKRQMLYVKNNSSAIVFRSFYRYLSLENNNSPVLLYRKDKFRNVRVISLNKIDADSVEVEYRAKVIDNNLGTIEDQIWKVKIDYYIEPLKADKFNFYITDYNPKLVKNLLEK